MSFITKLFLFFCLSLSFSCTRKYFTYPEVYKDSFKSVSGRDSFSQNSPDDSGQNQIPFLSPSTPLGVSSSSQNPTRQGMLLPTGKNDRLSLCKSQWLFFSNSWTETEVLLPQIVQSLCPGMDWLKDLRVEKTWWTLLFYSRSCLEISSLCAKVSRP
jgi:hypothetical protein